MLAWLTDPLASPVVQRALAEVLLLAIACGPLGVWVLLYRDAYAAESLSHGMLPGPRARRAGRRAAGARRRRAACSSPRPGSRSWPATRGWAPRSASPSCVSRCSASAGSSRSRPRRRRGWPSCCSATCSASTPPTSRSPACSRRSSRSRSPARTGRSRSTGFDRGSARALGAPPLRWELALLVLLAVTTVAAVQGLGNLLLVALILAPGAAALRLCRRLPAALALAAALAGAGRDRGAAALLPPGDRGGRRGGAQRGRHRRGHRAARWPHVPLTSRPCAGDHRPGGGQGRTRSSRRSCRRIPPCGPA